jgi:hypothetical protein
MNFCNKYLIGERIGHAMAELMDTEGLFSAITPRAEARAEPILTSGDQGPREHYGAGAACRSKLSVKSTFNFAVGPMTVP